MVFFLFIYFLDISVDGDDDGNDDDDDDDDDNRAADINARKSAGIFLFFFLLLPRRHPPTHIHSYTCILRCVLCRSRKCVDHDHDLFTRMSIISRYMVIL